MSIIEIRAGLIERQWRKTFKNNKKHPTPGRKIALDKLAEVLSRRYNRRVVWQEKTNG